MMADLDAIRDGYSEMFFGKPVKELTPDQLEEFEILFKMEYYGKKRNAPKGIMMAAQGGRIGYASGGGYDHNKRYSILIDKYNKGIPLTPSEQDELEML